MSNVRFRYLYRDAGNYKSWGDVVFSNLESYSATAAEEHLRRTFLPDGLFIAHQIRLPELFLFPKYRHNEDDHCFHEFDALEVTSDQTTDQLGRSLLQFLDEVTREGLDGWRAFDTSALS